MAPQKMLPVALLASLDMGQIEALIESYESTLAILRVRFEAARYQAQRTADHCARAKLARAARTHNKAERALIVWKFARRGLSNRDIASRLGCSTRTVERALSRLPEYPAAKSVDRI